MPYLPSVAASGPKRLLPRGFLSVLGFTIGGAGLMLENESKLRTSGSVMKPLRVPKSEGDAIRTEDKPRWTYPAGESLWPTRGFEGEQL